MTAGFGLSQEDLDREIARFGVADEQVRRDHAISHILAAISDSLCNEVVFFGGTALSRTHLIHARLSEDIDLIALGNRAEIAERFVRSIDTALRRSHGRLSWSPPFTTRDVDPAVIHTTSGTSIRVQLLDGRNYESWPTELHDIEQRYHDARPAALHVPTVASFAGSKTAAWAERGASRDLYDLWALAEARSITAVAATLFARFGPTGTPPREFMFSTPPSEPVWHAALAEQTRLRVTAAEALGIVRTAWADAVNERWG
ncbi:Predicted nucleotidyltransferase component of viral defense system [Actinopolymorpha cephalotaxi]|uniref:Nucleotidyltransferase component of viral defense system n=1 Tax=Actinopolymorpha cephalotaxi TaxID=504797 RepID=A0A1I2N422_9ACTN|nr:nucleotidyl transferase AbiEii/AbiGii toxin family protein [Actinopolymorpha cephalotaxi]NYH85721.1 putative nucleotidyltransferase component of viral defense system [Actinopolymorpha cephalotaxi]SFF97860.1 Predicted nucleotidyltransferase component of viral defense system [Actinopolymorpha cephalotaxi]